MELSEIILTTRESRIKLFNEKLQKKFPLFKDTIVNGVVCRIPKVNQVPNKRYCQFRVKLPIGYESNTKYRIRVEDRIFDLYKSDCNYYIINTINCSNIEDIYKEFRSTIQFSFVYYLLQSMLTEITTLGQSVYLTDMVFTDLTKRFHSEDGKLKITITPFGVKNKVMTNDHLYISIFK